MNQQQPHDTGPNAQVPLAELFRHYLERQVSAHSAGWAAAESFGEVEPYEVAASQPVDPRLAWEEGLVAVQCFAREKKLAELAQPRDWATLVAGHEPVVALPLCSGNYPQLLRNLQGLLQADDLTVLKPTAGRPTNAASLLDWASATLEKRTFPESVIALGALRLAKQFDAARKLIAEHGKHVPSAWSAAWLNEEAALAWHQGRADAAAAIWKSLPDSVPVSFNGGLAALFTGKPAAARSAFERVVAQLPESSAWHHLARLYLTLAEMRG
jgi:hypothetical protein